MVLAGPKGINSNVDAPKPQYYSNQRFKWVMGKGGGALRVHAVIIKFIKALPRPQKREKGALQSQNEKNSAVYARF